MENNKGNFPYYDGIEDDLSKIEYLDSKCLCNVDVNNPLRMSWIKEVLQDYHDLKTK